MRTNCALHVVVVVTCFMASLLVSPLIVYGQAPEEYPGQGKDQLVRALDAAIATVIENGQWRAIVNSDPAAAPLIMNMADCYPRTEDDGDIVYPFPASPTGLLEHILTTKEITVGDYCVIDDPQCPLGFVPGTFHVFDTVNPALLRAIFMH